MGGITDSIEMSLSKLQKLVINRKVWRAAVHGVTKSQTQLSDFTGIVTCPWSHDLLIPKIASV